MKNLVIGCIGACVLAACVRWMPPPPQHPPLNDCAAMCQRGTEMQCQWANPTPSGTTCMDLCLNTEASGFTTVYPLCVAELARDCEEAEYLSAHGCELPDYDLK